MADIVDSATRSRMMSGIKSKNTKPELLIRSGLHKRGFRYRLHDIKLPGRPDLVLPRYRAIIQVNGCFWHGHDCHLFKLPATRTEFWRAKIVANRTRDWKNLAKCRRAGWRVLTVWECALKGKSVADTARILDRIQHWLESDRKIKTIPVTSASQRLAYPHSQNPAPELCP